MEVAAERQKFFYGKRVCGEPYEVDDLVWLLNPAVPRGASRKLNCPWIGPLRVVKKLSDVTYHIQNTEGNGMLYILIDLSLVTQIQQRSHPASNTVPISVPAPIHNTVPPGTYLQITEDDDTDPQVSDQ